MRYLVSACLIGENCKYNGGNNANQKLIDFLQGKDYVVVCPEVLGGLPTPRASCEIVAGRVMNTQKEDKTREFCEGAQIALQIAKEQAIDLAITQSRSPSCGKGRRYSGRFDGTFVNGNGIFVDTLLQAGFCVMDVEEFVETIIDASENVKKVEQC